MKFQRVAILRDKGHPLQLCCEMLELTCAGFYKWLKSKLSKRKERMAKIRTKVKRIFHEEKGRYGSPRIHKKLQQSGEKVNVKTIEKIMREENLVARGKKAFRPRTTICDPKSRKSPRVFKIEASETTGPNKIWVSDLTYIPTGDGFTYLVKVMDLFNREIKGWSLEKTMEAKNTKAALLDALKKTPGELKGLIFHSDQGIQYCSDLVRDNLALLKITQSMSRRGNCYDNAFAESFFSSMKREIEKGRFRDLAEARREISEYIFWYNNFRLHSSLGFKSPMEYASTRRNG